MYSGWNGKYRSDEARRAHAEDGIDFVPKARYWSPEQISRYLNQRSQDEQRACAGVDDAPHRITNASGWNSVARYTIVVLLPLFLALLVLVFLVVFCCQ
jgi:hypothetical protein